MANSHGQHSGRVTLATLAELFLKLLRLRRRQHRMPRSAETRDEKIALLGGNPTGCSRASNKGTDGVIVGESPRDGDVHVALAIPGSKAIPQTAEGSAVGCDGLDLVFVAVEVEDRAHCHPIAEAAHTHVEGCAATGGVVRKVEPGLPVPHAAAKGDGDKQDGADDNGSNGAGPETTAARGGGGRRRKRLIGNGLDIRWGWRGRGRSWWRRRLRGRWRSWGRREWRQSWGRLGTQAAAVAVVGIAPDKVLCSTETAPECGRAAAIDATRGV